MFDAAILSGVLDLDSRAMDVLAGPPRVHLSTAAASTLVVDLDDDHELRDLYATLTATTLDPATQWHVAAIKRRPSGRTQLVFEDAVVTRLRDTTSTWSIPAGSTTVNEVAHRLARDAGVDVLLDPTRRTLTDALWCDGTAWAATRALADQAGWWRYSDGSQLVIASPDWLLTRPAVERTDNAGAVGTIEYTVDRGRPHETAAADIDDTWTPTLGEATPLTDVGAASGVWIVASYTQVLGEPTGRVTWTRPRSDRWL